MNVLKKDLFSKTGAKTKRKNGTGTVGGSTRNQNPLSFLFQHFEDQNSSLSQSSVASSSSVVSNAVSYFGEPIPSSRNNDFKLFMQPFINEVQSQREKSIFDDSLPKIDQDSPVFKKPRPVIMNESSGGNLDISNSTSDVLRILEESLSASQQNISELSFREPIDQNEDIGNELSAIDLDGMSEVSSIRPDNTHSTSTDKKTPKKDNTMGFSDSDVNYCIIAITEGRGHASGEVGIAAMDPRRPHLILCQISDSQRYAHTLSKMNVFHFTEAIVPNTFVDGPTPRKLYMDLLERFPSVTVNHVQRKHFSEAVGLQMIQQYCSKESESVMVVVKDKFYALAAAAALLKYIEFTQNVVIAARSLKVEYQGTDGTTIIDLDTASRLELVMGLVSREESHSLLGVLKHCRTKGGVRLLRANLLQPMADASKTNSRLDCVTELIENPILFNALESVISQMKNAENLLSLCMHPPQQNGLKSAQFQLKYTLLLKSTLELVPSLISALQDANSDYYTYVRENLQDTRLASVLRRVLQTVVEGTPGNRPGTFNILNACFMIRPGINGLLDVAKKTYCEIAQEIADLVNALKTKHNLPLRLGFSQSKGYHIQISPIDRIQTDNLPEEFILIQKSRNTLTCYTTEIVALDQRCQQALHEIELMTNVLLFELLNDIRGEISCLFPLCECLAELDVCIAFAHIGAGEGYVRPQFDDELRLVDARHPILDATLKEKVVPNDVFADVDNNFIILTGPNQSGKSIYIRQVALLQVMAQIGCYVPAKEATFRIADRIFSRIGFDDNIESNSSTLMVEMQDMEFIRKNLTANSLVIIDELCRGTSIEEGTCLAFVLCEELLDTSAFVFFTSHFLFITKLQSMYCNVRNYHFETLIDNDVRPGLKFTHKMLQGVTPAESYGIRLAELMGYPDSILNLAKKAAAALLAERKPNSEICGFTERYEISKAMRMELPQENATWDELLVVIRRFKAIYAKLPIEGEAILEKLGKEIAEIDKMKNSTEQVMPDNVEEVAPSAVEDVTMMDASVADFSLIEENFEKESQPKNVEGDSQNTRDAAMLLLSLHQEGNFKVPVKKQPKQTVDEFLREASAELPPVSDKSQYYEWKYSRNKKELKAIAGASRASPASNQFRSVTPKNSKY